MPEVGFEPTASSLGGMHSIQAELLGQIMLEEGFEARWNQGSLTLFPFSLNWLIESFYAEYRIRTYVGTKPTDIPFFYSQVKGEFFEALIFLNLESVPFDHSGNSAL